MTSVVLFVLAILMPIYAGRVVWKRLDKGSSDTEVTETATVLVKKVVIVALTVLFGMAFGFWIINLLIPMLSS